jgi:hypothetical protein
MDKIYRVGLESYGIYYEKFYPTLDSAQKAYEQLVEEKKKAPQTLSDEDMEEYEEGYDSKNFTESTPPTTDKDGKITLRRTFWSYGYNSDYEGGTEYYTSTDHIILEEIPIENAT